MFSAQNSCSKIKPPLAPQKPTSSSNNEQLFPETTTKTKPTRSCTHAHSSTQITLNAAYKSFKIRVEAADAVYLTSTAKNLDETDIRASEKIHSKEVFLALSRYRAIISDYEGDKIISEIFHKAGLDLTNKSMKLHQFFESDDDCE